MTDREAAAFSLYASDSAHIWIECYKYILFYGNGFLVESNKT